MARKTHDPLIFRFLNEIGIIDQLASAKVESVLPDGLKMSQFIVLNHLARLGGRWSPARLANAFQVTKGAITNTLQRLESRGLVKVESDPSDGRGKLVSLTATGRNMRIRCVHCITPLFAEFESEFGGKRLENAIPLLEDIRTYLDEHR